MKVISFKADFLEHWGEWKPGISLASLESCIAQRLLCQLAACKMILKKKNKLLRRVENQDGQSFGKGYQ
jgi:hypothetical protein